MRGTKDPAIAAAALAMLAERVSTLVVPPARRMTSAAMRKVAPEFRPEALDAVAIALEQTRSLNLGDAGKTVRVRAAINTVIRPSLADPSRPTAAVQQPLTSAILQAVDSAGR